MDEDLVLAARLGLVLVSENVPEGARIEPPLLRFDPALSRTIRARIVYRLLTQANEHIVRGLAPSRPLAAG
jgi:hypothetical protein